jgi:glycosyltransferase involved in cell wall biosynthesis
MSPIAPPALSVVVPVYNEQGNVVPLCTEIREEMRAIGRPFEMIFVNDGSQDATLAQLREFAAGEPRLRILDLDGNFGEAGALSAGFQAARGELVVTLDGDGQNDPRDIPRLLDRIEQDGRCVVVSGRRLERQEGMLLRVLPSRIANWLIATVSGLPTHDNGCGLKIYRRSVVTQAVVPRGWNRFLPALFGVRPEQVAEVTVSDRRRQHGQSHYGFSRTLIVMRDLLALRFIMADAQRAEPAAAAVAMVAAAGVIYGFGHSLKLAGFSAVVGAVALLIWRNLRRYNHARRQGVFRVRREYTSLDQD